MVDQHSGCHSLLCQYALQIMRFLTNTPLTSYSNVEFLPALMLSYLRAKLQSLAETKGIVLRLRPNRTNFGFLKLGLISTHMITLSHQVTRQRLAGVKALMAMLKIELVVNATFWGLKYIYSKFDASNLYI